MPSSNFDLIDLCRRLRQEKLFVANDRTEIEGINRKVQLLSTGLLHQTWLTSRWLTGQHHLALEKKTTSTSSTTLLASNGGDPLLGGSIDLSSISSSNLELTENLQLLQASKLINSRSLPHFIDLISLLRSQPEIIALLLTTYEKERSLQTTPFLPFTDVLQSVINIYRGIGGPLPGDSSGHLKLLSHLASYQLVGVENARRVLHHQGRAGPFTFLYRLISETAPSSRQFLVGALHQPITQLLSSPELLSLGGGPSNGGTSPMDQEAPAQRPCTN